MKPVKDGATPRPWRISKSGNPNFIYCVVAPDGGSVCFITDWNEHEANAKLIVKAVNCHDELVDLLKESLLAIPKSYITLTSDIKQALSKVNEVSNE